VSEWKQTTIGELCDAGIAQLQTGPFGSQLHAYDYVHDGVAVIPTEAIRDRQIDHSVLPKITSSKAKELDRHKLRKGDILFARRGVQATGHIGCIREAEEGFICGTGAIRLRISARVESISADFISHVLANPASVAWFKFHAIGATMPNLNETIIRSFPFELPPPGEQKGIASLLSAFDDRIELNRRMNETLEAMARATFKDLFIDFGPTRAKMDGRAAYLAPEIWALFPDRLDDAGKPEDWISSTIGQEVDVVGGSTPSTKELDFWGGDIAWATPKDLSSLSTPVLLSTERQITDAGLSQIGSGLLPVGTVLLSSRAPIGYMAIAQIPCAVNQGFIAMVCRKRLSKIFVWLWTQANMDKVLQNANGSTFQEISKANFRPIPVTVAQPDILRVFDEMAGALFDRIVSNDKENRSLAAMRDLLLPKLMSGELRLRDAEKALEAVA
jgi:type I restriction enzyme S subunit